MGLRVVISLDASSNDDEDGSDQNEESGEDEQQLYSNINQQKKYVKGKKVDDNRGKIHNQSNTRARKGQ